MKILESSPCNPRVLDLRRVSSVDALDLTYLYESNSNRTEQLPSTNTLFNELSGQETDTGTPNRLKSEDSERTASITSVTQ